MWVTTALEICERHCCGHIPEERTPALREKLERTEEISELGHTMQALCSTWGGHVGVFTGFCLTFSVLRCCNETYYGGTVDIICCICLSNNALICVFSLK